MHSNQDVALDSAGDISLNRLQKLRYIHSKDPRVSEVPARIVKIPAGNSFRIKVHSTKQLDGTPGSITLTHYSYPDGAMTVDNLVPSSEWFEYDPSAGDSLIVAEGCDFEVEVRDENLPIDCAHVPSMCPTVPDGGGTDAGPGDAGTGVPDGGPTPPADGGPTPPDDAGPGEPDAGDPVVPDAGDPPAVDAGEGRDASTDSTDAADPADASEGHDDAGAADAGSDTDASGTPDASDGNDAGVADGGGDHNGDADGNAGSPDVSVHPPHDSGSADVGHTDPGADHPTAGGDDIRVHRADEGENGGGCDCYSVSKTNDAMFDMEKLGLYVALVTMALRRRARKVVG
jgi:hypothetical protein